MDPNTQKKLNGVVLALAAACAFGAIYMNTRWLNKSSGAMSIERERCYGITRAGKNDCGTTTHSCAHQSEKNNHPNEWIMLPKGTCQKISGGLSG